MKMLRNAWLICGLLATASATAADRPVMNGRLGPPTPETCFWSSRDYVDLPERGPAAAAGIILWNHGQAGSGEPSWQNGPSPVIRLFAEAGWDVLLVQRNPRCEGKWEHKGNSYVANLLREVDQAKAQGYRRVLVAGQSYGAGTAMGAAGQSDRIDGVLAFALSHGRGSCRDSGSFKPWMVPQHEQYISESLRQARSPRLLVSMVSDDHCFNHSFTPTIAKELAAKPAAYIHFDETAPFSGHSAAMKRDFAAMYGPCILSFFTQDAAPPGGRHVCPPA